MPDPTSTPTGPRLRRALGLWDLVLYGIVLIQPTAPMPLFGEVSVRAKGHVVTAVLIAMVAMLFTAISYGRMARVYPSAGSAFTYVGREIHPALGYITGWSMAMDYMLNPIICAIWCSRQAVEFAPVVPYEVWVVFFALLFTGLNLRGIQASARTNAILAAALGAVILVVFAAAIRYILGLPVTGSAFFTRPFYDPATYSTDLVLRGTSLAALTYIGFDGISTLSEEVHNPRRNILLATVLTCLITGVLASAECYIAQLVWPAAEPFPKVETAYSHVAERAGGPWVGGLVGIALLVATIGSGTGAQLGAARLLYGMGRGNVLPKRFFAFIDPKRHIPRNNVLLVGALALAGAFIFELVVSKLNVARPGDQQLTSYGLGAEMLNFGAFIAFIGVNLAAFTRYFVRGEKRLANLLPPLAGAAICAYIWWNLNLPAKILGGAWMSAGILYGAIRTRGFRRELVDFELPPE